VTRLGRIIAAIALLASGFVLSGTAFASADSAADGKPAAGISLADLRRFVGLESQTKPADTTYRGADSCQWANDGECDDPGIGTGACVAGTDYSDCWRIATGVEDDSCRWANDGECDEPHLGTGACLQATDFSDCEALIYLRFLDDSCAYAFDGVCNEPGVGDGTCEARTDRSDCVGRERPMAIDDHFHGFDDRVLFETASEPWMAVGWIEPAAGGFCTATLVAESVVVTAAHCIEFGGTIAAAGTFLAGFDRSGGPLSAGIEAYVVSDRRSAFLESPSHNDWVLLRLDRPIGRELGYVAGATLKAAGGDWRSFELFQAGYSWDTDDYLSGHLGCRILAVRGDGAIEHDCDTTHGDSGSPLMVVVDGDYRIIATDSAFDLDFEPAVYLATPTHEWVPLVDDFAAGLIGTAVTANR